MLGKDIHGTTLRFFRVTITQEASDIPTDQIGFNVDFITNLAILQCRQSQRMRDNCQGEGLLGDIINSQADTIDSDTSFCYEKIDNSGFGLKRKTPGIAIQMTSGNLGHAVNVTADKMPTKTIRKSKCTFKIDARTAR